MTKYFLPTFFLVIICGMDSRLTMAQGDNINRIHIPRRSQNLVPDPSVTNPKNWSLSGTATFDPTASRNRDGSGSLKLIRSKNKSGAALSKLIPVTGGQVYSVSFDVKSTGGPTFAGAQLKIYGKDRKFMRNLANVRTATTEDGIWQEIVLPVFVPKNVSFVRVQAYKAENTQPNGAVWVDELYFGEGLGFKQPPAVKRSFEGQHVRVDALGNFEVKKNGTWFPFFPMCMYSDNQRDWKHYSRQGWNTIIWAGSAAQVQKAKDAVSNFNPDGMMAGFQISQYTFPSGWAYGNLKSLEDKLREIFEQRLDSHLLMYYLDNENNHDQWKVPNEVIRTIQQLDTDRNGFRWHPMYALQGNYCAARLHAARSLVDVSGTYVSGTVDKVGQIDTQPLTVLDNLEGQTSPASFAQFNGLKNPGGMRLRLYNSLIAGAKAIGYWRDNVPSKKEPSGDFAGPVDEQAWWDDFPNLRREVDQLLPLIREPHWTRWTAKGDAGDAVRIGTRKYGGECYLILVNQTTQRQTFSVSLAGLPYQPAAINDALRGQPIANVQYGSFSMELAPMGINSGTKVLRIIPAR